MSGIFLPDQLCGNGIGDSFSFDDRPNPFDGDRFAAAAADKMPLPS